MTFSIWMFSNDIPVTEPVPPCHVLILSPLSDSLMTALRTVTLETHARELCTPRLPMLQKTEEPKSGTLKRMELLGAAHCIQFKSSPRKSYTNFIIGFWFLNDCLSSVLLHSIYGYGHFRAPLKLIIFFSVFMFPFSLHGFRSEPHQLGINIIVVFKLSLNKWD